MDITTIGFDLAKTVFQVHGADAEGRPVLRRKLRRGKVLAFFAGLPSCLVGMEACASAHYWARELQALGHKVRLIPPQYVRPFVKTNKNDAADAEAICEAVTRPTMRFAPAKSTEQQSVLMLHRARELLVRQKTMLINALRGHCGEFGIVVSQGASRVAELIAIIEDREDDRSRGRRGLQQKPVPGGHGVMRAHLAVRPVPGKKSCGNIAGYLELEVCARRFRFQGPGHDHPPGPGLVDACGGEAGGVAGLLLTDPRGVENGGALRLIRRAAGPAPEIDRVGRVAHQEIGLLHAIRDRHRNCA